MPSTQQILQRIVAKSGLSLRAFAEAHGEWDHGHLARTLDGKKSIGPAVVGRLLVHLDAKTAAKLIAAYLAEQRQLIERERRKFKTSVRPK
jgi:hypothetical protein